MRKEEIRRGTSIRCMKMISDEKEFFVRFDYDSIDLSELIQQATNHFAQYDIVFNLNDFTITSEYIHEDCLGYDRYDPCDYGKYIIISRKII